MNKLISEGKLKANEIRNNLKNLETTSTRSVASPANSVVDLEWYIPDPATSFLSFGYSDTDQDPTHII